MNPIAETKNMKSIVIAVDIDLSSIFFKLMKNTANAIRNRIAKNIEKLKCNFFIVLPLVSESYYFFGDEK